MELAIIARLPPCMASSTRLLHTCLRPPPNHRHTRSTFSPSSSSPSLAIIFRVRSSSTSCLRVEGFLDQSSSSSELRGFGRRWKWTEVSTGKGACRGPGVRIWASGGQAQSGKRWALASVTEDVTNNAVVGQPEHRDSTNSLGQGGGDVRSKRTWNLAKSGLKNEGFKSAEAKFHSSKRLHQFGSRTFTSSRQTNTSYIAAKEIMNKNSGSNFTKMENNGKGHKRPAPSDQNGADERKSKKKNMSAESQLRRSLDMCSKHGDAMLALEIYDKLTSDGRSVLNQYNYNILLYLCSSAATGALKRGKSGNEKLKSSGPEKLAIVAQDDSNGTVATESKAEATETGEVVVLTDEEKQLCLNRGFEIYEAMKLRGVPPNEATFTAVARLAEAKEDGNLAFEMVKRMAEANIAPRLRSYGPALYTYCKLKDVNNAFEVDKHMEAAGVALEESELKALLKLSADAGLEDKIYTLLHRLRTTVRELSPSTVEVIQQWFQSSSAAHAGSAIWENLPGPEIVKAATESCGGGWHGLGWLGKGAWTVKPSLLDKGGVCCECGEQLVTIDIDPKETEMFADSLSTLACQREARNNEFKKFQAWLDRHGPFDVIVDGANIGLYNQNFSDGGFNFFQLNSVVNGIKEKLGLKKEPLILLHHKRTKGGAAASPYGSKTLNRWKEANSIYTTPTGSNDDWYWLYAAVRYKCMLVTNDEMRDHLFQLLGNDFFPKWKERHQVRYTFSKEGPIFHMPPPYSILIQESEKGSWHIPKSGGDDISSSREWLCVTRPSIVTTKNGTSKEILREFSESVSEECKPLAEDSLQLNESSVPVKKLPKSPKKLLSTQIVLAKSQPLEVSEIKDNPTSPRKVQVGTRRSQSPESPSTLETTREVLEVEDAKKKVQSPVKRVLSPKSPSTLERIMASERKADFEKKLIDFQI